MRPGSIPGGGIKKIYGIIMNNLTHDLFNKFANYIYTKSGIHLKDSKLTLLENRLRKRVRDLNLETFEAYWHYLNSLQHNRDETYFLWDLVTTNETYFYRGNNHLDILKDYIFPKLNPLEPIKIWSAGCSSGEEPYDIAMTIESYSLLHGSTKASIIASDLSNEILSEAKKGIYNDRKVAKLPEKLKNKYLTLIPNTQPNEYQIDEKLKSYITFKQHNLLQDVYPVSVDVIFCRNVMIYFDQPTYQKVVNNFYKALKPGGYFFISQSESLQIIESEFTAIRMENGTVYQKSL